MTVLVYLHNRATGKPGSAVATFPNAGTIEAAEQEAYMKYNDGTTEVVYVRECSPDACGYTRTDMTTSVACKDAQGNITGYVYKRVYKRGGRLYICHKGEFVLLDRIFQNGTDFFNA